MQQLGLTDAERFQLEAKVQRLMEMGFSDRAAVTEALLVHGMSEEAALNALLGAPTVQPGAVGPPVQQAPPQVPPKPASSGSGIFGRWGK
ncbi:MAG: hypothetical protein EBZ48_15805 [Proteobacteria bacterium]|nr:hypothetical protein [Pseudomonadota bacterium]